MFFLIFQDRLCRSRRHLLRRGLRTGPARLEQGLGPSKEIFRQEGRGSWKKTFDRRRGSGFFRFKGRLLEQQVGRGTRADEA